MSKELHAIVVNQWLREWDEVAFDEEINRKKPEPRFYIFSISGKDLKRLSDVHRRQADQPRASDTGIQRKHSSERSAEISEYILGGFPWSTLSQTKRTSNQYSDLRMPGWLPTSIIANIKAPNTARRGAVLQEIDCIKVTNIENGTAKIILPEGFELENWNPSAKPIEIIDGQHRLLAFDEVDDLNGEFEFPIVAFYDLDITWQAYLFYVINIKPKKINTSLAYDLYPVLRIQDWLEKAVDNGIVYRETRAQELTEILWSHKSNPWYKRINMLGEAKRGKVSQAAFIRALTASYVKSWGGPQSRLGGLFGAPISGLQNDILYWNRTQQGAFLVLVWKLLYQIIENSVSSWAVNLREINQDESSLDPAFSSKYSLISTDQGIRGILQITNDLCYLRVSELGLNDWVFEYKSDSLNLKEVNDALAILEQHPVCRFLEKIFTILMDFDWRTYSTPNLEDQVRINQMAFRGSGGYREIRRQLLDKLIEKEDEEISVIAIEIKDILNY